MPHPARVFVTVLGVLTLVVSLAPVGRAESHPITGTYVVTLGASDLRVTPGPMVAQLAGKWSVTFAADGSYTVRKDGADRVNGKYTMAGDEVTLMDIRGDLACVGDGLEGVYNVKRVKNVVTFTKVKDTSCPGRVAALTSRPFTVAR
jgi:hypothetical protein